MNIFNLKLKVQNSNFEIEIFSGGQKNHYTHFGMHRNAWALLQMCHLLGPSWASKNPGRPPQNWPKAKITAKSDLFKKPYFWLKNKVFYLKSCVFYVKNKAFQIKSLGFYIVLYSFYWSLLPQNELLTKKQKIVRKKHF